jgi:uncharacterized surface protein with fasciclin (FAS1) repeats
MKKLILSLLALSAFTFSYAQKTTADVIIKSNKFSTLETALVSAELIPTLQASGPFTVFAPTNDAFDKLSPGVLGNLLTAASHDKLVTILKYHVMAGKWSTSSIKKAIKTGSGKADLRTIEGKTIVAIMVGNKIKLTDDLDRSAYIKMKNKRTSNGILHSIDAVLMPNLK